MACNYDEDAEFDDGSCAAVDCAGVCGGLAYVDECDDCIEHSSIVDVDSGLEWSDDLSDLPLGDNGVLVTPADAQLANLAIEKNVKRVIYVGDWHSKRPKDLQLLYNDEVISEWIHPPTNSSATGCYESVYSYVVGDDEYANSPSSCVAYGSSSYSSGYIPADVEIENASELTIRIVSTYDIGNSGNVVFIGLWIEESDGLHDC